METSIENFVDRLRTQGLAMIRIREKDEACAGCLEFVTKKGVIFLVGTNWFDCNIVDVKPYMKLASIRNRLNRQISSLKKASLKT